VIADLSGQFAVAPDQGAEIGDDAIVDTLQFYVDLAPVGGRGFR